MANANLKSKMVEKGERYAFFAAIGLMVLLCVMGVLSMSDAKNPEDLIKDIDSHTKKITASVNGSGKADKLPDFVDKTYVHAPVKASDSNSTWFDPFNPPDSRR